ncbi:hypothetical protein [Yersinia phage fHe-Yen9-04]|uniref:Adenine-specific DNA methylase n=1 Tax=Yersinia phage fHe-Yen9-04 TaxID=2052742 RepID=A0A2C9CWW7_9CAUD|nr:DNA methyltransferase [Yersinia phage fHe-Yen9-04]SOK58399.1 hypothetical protein [Yersinia phage fHe-Yen9-04]VUE36168.1 hypothetical protein [Yersinia phage fHe-Yen9-04]
MKITRSWAMPNKNTFLIKPIRDFIERELSKVELIEDAVFVDAFANNSIFNPRMTYTNDLDPDMPTTHHMDALEFLKSLESESVDFLLFDPPYSPRQVSECYKSLEMTVNMQTTQSSFWGNLKKEIARVMKTGGVVMTFGWNSGGIGKSNGFEIDEILFVAHGGWHTDTFCVKDIKK